MSVDRLKQLRVNDEITRYDVTMTIRRIRPANGVWFEVTCCCYSCRKYGWCEELTLTLADLREHWPRCQFTFPDRVTNPSLPAALSWAQTRTKHEQEQGI